MEELGRLCIESVVGAIEGISTYGKKDRLLSTGSYDGEGLLGKLGQEGF